MLDYVMKLTKDATKVFARTITQNSEPSASTTEAFCQITLIAVLVQLHQSRRRML